MSGATQRANYRPSTVEITFNNIRLTGYADGPFVELLPRNNVKISPRPRRFGSIKITLLQVVRELPVDKP